MTERLLTIGEVATSVGVKVSAVRYYDEIGLISSATRVGGKRRFDAATVGRINFVQRAKGAGFSLEEISQILADDSGDWHSLVAAKLAELRHRRDQLDTTIALLSEIQTCGCEVVATCPQYEKTSP